VATGVRVDASLLDAVVFTHLAPLCVKGLV
jgi:hypothetical protein